MRMSARRFAVAIVVSAVVAATAAGSAAMAGQDASGTAANNVRERLTGYQEDPLVLSTTGTGRIVLRINERAAVDRVQAQLQQPGGHRPPSAHPHRRSVTERRDQRLPLHERRQRAGRHGGLPAGARHGRGDDHASDRHRAGGAGRYRRTVRRASRCDPGRCHVRQRAQQPVPRRRDPGPARRSPLNRTNRGVGRGCGSRAG